MESGSVHFSHVSLRWGVTGRVFAIHTHTERAIARDVDDDDEGERMLMMGEKEEAKGLEEVDLSYQETCLLLTEQ